jgi:DNA-binding transcriptional MocR family regulator
MIAGDIDTTYQTMQRDLFTGGLVGRIGPNAFAVWSAIKHHADFESGFAWPSVRRLAEMTGMGNASVMRAVETLEAEHMLRKAAVGWPSTPAKGGRGRAHTYIACERLDVRMGSMVLCTIVVDYVPHRLAERLESIQRAFKDPKAKGSDALLAQVKIIPADGFVWDAEARALVKQIPLAEVAEAQASALPTPRNGPTPEQRRKLAAAIKSIKVLKK